MKTLFPKRKILRRQISVNRWNVICTWAWSERDPRMKPTVHNPPRTRGYFARWPRAFSTEKKATLAQATKQSFTKYCPCHENDTPTSPNIAPATKSDDWTSPNAAPATKSDTWTSPNAAPATKSDAWTSPYCAFATKTSSWRCYWTIVYTWRF